MSETPVEPVEDDTETEVVTDPPEDAGETPDLGETEVVTDEPEDDEPAEATEEDQLLADGGRTDNSGELTEPPASQDPNLVVESDPGAEQP